MTPDELAIRQQQGIEQLVAAAAATAEALQAMAEVMARFADAVTGFVDLAPLDDGLKGDTHPWL